MWPLSRVALKPCGPGDSNTNPGTRGTEEPGSGGSEGRNFLLVHQGREAESLKPHQNQEAVGSCLWKNPWEPVKPRAAPLMSPIFPHSSKIPRHSAKIHISCFQVQVLLAPGGLCTCPAQSCSQQHPMSPLGEIPCGLKI